jgi:O-antigen/teichoic acid export membrane protein
MAADGQSDIGNSAQTVRRVARNAGYLALADIANKVLVFVFYIIAARHLGVAKFGILSFALAFVTMFGVLTDLGLGTVITREIAQGTQVARSHIRNVLAIKILASIVVMAMIAGAVKLMGYPAATAHIVFICSAFVLTNAVALFYCAVFQGLERMEFVAGTRLVQTIVLVAGAALLSRGTTAVERYSWLYVVAGLVSVLLAATSASVVHLRPGLRFAFGEWWVLLRASLPLGLAATFTMFYFWCGTTLLSKLRGDEAVGNYSAAFRLTMGLAFAGFAFSAAVYPLFSRLFVSSSERLARALELSVRYMVMLMFPVAAFGVVFARPAVILLYGSNYDGAVVVLRILGWWGVCAALNSLLSNCLISTHRAGIVAVQTGLALVVSLALNLVLIPGLGAAGAALAIVVAEFVGFVFLAVLLLRSPMRIGVRAIVGGALRTIAALAVAVTVAVVVARWHVVVAAVTGLLCYCVLLLVVGGVDRADLKMLRPLLVSKDG